MGSSSEICVPGGRGMRPRVPQNISIIIRAYNEERHIERLLLGIEAQGLTPHEIILVDSGSTDATVEIALRHGAKVVAVDKEEFTFGRALNRGCAAATGDVLVFASAHVYPVYDSWLQKLSEPFRDERVVLSYGRQRGNEVNKFSEKRIFDQWFPAQSESPQRTYFCNNANCAIRRSEWERLAYDETLTGLEDLAWAKAAQARGGLIAYVAEAEIVHVHDETWSQIRNRYRREAIALRAIDAHARFSLADFVRLMAKNVGADLRAAARQGVLRKEIGSILMFRFHQFLGTYKGYGDSPAISAEVRTRFYYPKSHSDADIVERERRHEQIDYVRAATERADQSNSASDAPKPLFALDSETTSNVAKHNSSKGIVGALTALTAGVGFWTFSDLLSRLAM
jgi:glycosyltransferase involved in cell wall biosynthesis